MNVFFDADRRLRNGWWVLVFYVVLAVFVVPGVVLAHHFQAEIKIWQQALVVIAVTVVCQRLLRQRPLAEVWGPFDRRWVAQWVIGGALGSLVMVLPAAGLALTGHVRFKPSEAGLTALLPGFGLYVAVAVTEELIFRGFQFQRLIAGLGAWPAQVLMAAYFLLNHINNPGMTGTARLLAGANIFLMSMLLGLTYLRTRSLATALGIHTMANWVQGTLFGFGVSGTSDPGAFVAKLDDSPTWLSGGSVGLEASVPGLVVLAVVTLLYWRATNSQPAAAPTHSLGPGSPAA